MVTLDMWRFTSGVPNNLITVHSGDKNTSFILTVDEGEFWSYEEQIYTKRVELKPEDTTRWNDIKDSCECDYIRIVAKNNDDIVGYAAVKVNQVDGLNYNATVLKSVWFDSSEEVTPEQVDSLIEQAIKG